MIPKSFAALAGVVAATTLLLLVASAAPAAPTTARVTGRVTARVTGRTAERSGPTYANPVITANAPDPDVVESGGTYYAFTTGGLDGPIQLFISTDLAHWRSTPWPGPLVRDATWTTFGDEWAPGVIHVGDTWILFYATLQTATGAECITEAQSPTVVGPYVNNSAAPLACDAIDPSPVVGPDGSLYLTYKANEAAGRDALLVSQPLEPDGRGFLAGSGPTVLLGAAQGWESTVENPDLVEIDGTWRLFFSGGTWDDATYATGVATCAGPLGPCTQPAGGPLLTSTTRVIGPGGASAFRDTAGQWWLAYAAIPPGRAAHDPFGNLVRSMGLEPICPAATGGSAGVNALTVPGPTLGRQDLRHPCSAAADSSVLAARAQ